VFSLWLLHLSVALLLRAPTRQLALLGGVEAAAALLFLFRRSRRWGGLLLLLVFSFAAGFHLRAGENAAPLLGYAVVVTALLFAPSGATSEGLRAAISSALPPADQAFLHAFETGAILPADFHHKDHIHAAWATLRSYPVSEALTRFSAGLRRFAAAAGKPGLYHETITWAYLFLIQERLERDGRERTFTEFAARNSDLFTWKPSVLDAYYRAEVLGSDLARRVFILPQTGTPAQAEVPAQAAVAETEATAKAPAAFTESRRVFPEAP